MTAQASAQQRVDHPATGPTASGSASRIDRPSLGRSLRRLAQPGLDQVWPLVILAGFGFYVSLVPVIANDFWWHLKIGEWIFQHGSIPTSNMFGWSLPADQPFTYAAWLGEYLYYVAYHWGRLPLVIFVHNVMALAAFSLVAHEAWRRSGSWRIAALVTVPACVMAMSNLIVRPQNWSWLPFMVGLILLNRFADQQLRARWLLLLPLIMVFWVNVHGAFVLGPVLVGVFFVGEGIRSLFRLPGALPRRQIGGIGGIGVLSVLATVVNPRFVSIYGYVLRLMTDKPSQGLIEEWQSPTPAGIANTAFFATILLVLVALIYSRYRPTPTELLLVVGFLWLAWSGQRYIVWFGMVSMPILAVAIRDLPLRAPHFRQQRNWLNGIICLMLFVPVVLVQPWFVERMPLPDEYWEMVWRPVPEGPLVRIDTPVTAVEHLRANPGGRLFNEMGYGSFLIWALPEQGVFVDPRVELYPYEQWQDYIRISRGVRYNELLDSYGADRILLNSELQPELAKTLPSDPGWRLEFEDGRAQIWAKR